MSRYGHILALARSDSLRDAQQPGVCPTCISLTSAFLHQANGTSSPPILEDFRDNHPEFWDDCITFLTARRREEDLPSLRAQLVENARTCPHRTLHNSAMMRLEDPLYVLVEALYEDLIACLALGNHPLLRTERAYTRKGMGKRRGRWPATADQLFPFGEQQCAEMHVFWLAQRFSPAPLSLLNATLMVARPKVLPHICAGHTQARLLYVLAQMLHADLADAPEGWAGAPPVRGAAAGMEDPDVRGDMRGAAATFLDVLAHGPDSTAHDFARAFAGHERAVFHAVLAALRTDAQLRARAGALQAATRFACALLRTLGLPVSVLAGVLAPRPPPDASAGDTQLAQPVYHQLRALRRQRGCSSAACGRSVLDNGGRAYPACARCRAVQYCGRACQQRDWSTGQYPHKTVCPLLVRLLAHASPAMDLPEFTRAYERALPDFMGERAVLLQWAFCSGLLHGEEETQFLKAQFKAANDLMASHREERNDILREITGLEDISHLTEEEKSALMRKHADEPVSQRIRDKYGY